MIRISERTTALLIMNTTADQLQPGIIDPNAVPAAGGCSVSVIAITMMLRPTDRAAIRSDMYRNPSTTRSRGGHVQDAGKGRAH